MLCFMCSPIDEDDDGEPEVTRSLLEITCFDADILYRMVYSFDETKEIALAQLSSFEEAYEERLAITRSHILQVTNMTEDIVMAKYREKERLKEEEKALKVISKIEARLLRERKTAEGLPDRIAKLQRQLDEVKKRETP